MNSIKNFPILQIWINVGTSSELPKQKGIAHIAEHMVFRARDPNTGQLLVNQLYEKKIKINAFTSHNYTVFILSGIKALDAEVYAIIKRMILTPYFLNQDLEAEKKVILNELDEVTGNFQKSMLRLFKRLEGHYWGYDLLGDKIAISRAKEQDVLNYFKQHFREKNLTFVANDDSSPSLKLIKKRDTVFKLGKSSCYSFFDKQNNYGHFVLKITNLNQYGAVLILQDFLQARGIRHTLIMNKQVQMITFSKYMSTVDKKTIANLLNDFSVEQFHRHKLNLTLAFRRDQATGNNHFHETEWQLEFGKSVSFRKFQKLFMDFTYDEFRDSVTQLLTPVPLNAKFNFIQTKKNKPSNTIEEPMFCLSLAIPFGYLDEPRNLTGFTFVLSEVLSLILKEKFQNEELRVVPEFSHDHYGVTIWGVGNKVQIEKQAYQIINNISISEENAHFYTLFVNRKINLLKLNENFEIESDRVYFKDSSVNLSRYPDQEINPKDLDKMLKHHQSLLPIGIIRTMKPARIPKIIKSSPSTRGAKRKKKIFLHKIGEKAEFMVYYQLPEKFNSFDQILSISAYVNREEFGLFNKLKYEMGFLYSLKVKLQKIRGAFYLKMRFSSSFENQEEIQKTVNDFDLDRELLAAHGYYQSSGDIFSKNRELLLKKLV